MKRQGYYEPREDSFLLLEQIKKYSKGNVLDMGTGSGILAIECARYAKHLVAVDINSGALKFAQENVRKRKIKNIEFRYSDLFSNVKGKFDLIIFNPPYLPRDRRLEEDKDIEGGKKGYEIIERFLYDANNYLKKNGKILLLFSSLTDKNKVDEFIDQNLFRAKTLSKEKLFFETLYVYLIEKSNILTKLEKVSNLRLHAKGKRGLIYSGLYKTEKVAVKIKEPKSKAVGRIRNEANYLKIVNKKGIGARLFTFTNDYIIMEFVDGMPILDFFDKNSERAILSVIKQIFEQLFVLDKLGINKEEMHRPIKHIIITKNNKVVLIDAQNSKNSGISKTTKVVLIDFERAKKSNKTHNVTQFCQFLVGGNVRQLLNKKGINISRKGVLEAARVYSKSKNKTQLDKILGLIG